MEPIDVAGLLLFVAIALSPAYMLYRLYRQRIPSWQALAKSNNLTYTPDSWFRDSGMISGAYRAYYLELKAAGARLGKEEGYTYIVLFADKILNNKLAIIKEKLTNYRGIEGLDVFKEAPQNIRGRFQGVKDPELLRYEQQGIETDIEYLQSLFDLLGDVAEAYSSALVLEGKAIPVLLKAIESEQNHLYPVILQLLDDIFQKVTTRLQNTGARLFCRDCLTYYRVYKVDLSWRVSIRYYGCRLCGQSATYFEGNRVVAILDADLKKEQLPQGDVLWINWFMNRGLFDFDEVRLIKATDEDVERFVMQISNDTDPTRVSLYEKMKCDISENCEYSPNTIRILKRTFGDVKVKYSVN